MIKYFHLRNIFAVLLMTALCATFSACNKDAEFDKGYYLYTHDSLTPLDSINGLFIRWNKEASPEQKEVVLKMVANMVKVEGGTFAMGAQLDNPSGANYDPQAQSNESPVHSVTLSSFYINKFEVTQREWSTIMGWHQWDYNAGDNDQIPAYSISYWEAKEFVNKLNALSNIQFDLPTEAQWEFAARGGNYSQNFLYSGSNNVDEVAWTKNNADAKVHAVGEKLPNELGLYDMSGGVWEWCRDEYLSYAEDASTDPCIDAWYHAVLRGGGWSYLPAYSRVAARDHYDIGTQSFANGFRLTIKDWNL